MDEQQRQYHRLFGLSWRDYLHGQPVTVEVEKDLSLKQQYLDVVLVRADGPLTVPLPDGFETFGRHNLISFKSHQEALDGWALNELIGHYVNYRKQASPSMQDLLPEDEFRLFAVCARYPRGLAGAVPLDRVREGIYEVRHFTGVMRIIVAGQLPMERQNAILCLFSASQERQRYGAETYEPRSRTGTTFLLDLFADFRKEGLPMPYTFEDLWRDQKARFLKEMTAEELLEHVPVERRLEGVPVERRLEGVPADAQISALSPEALEELRRRLLAGEQTPPRS